MRSISLLLGTAFLFAVTLLPQPVQAQQTFTVNSTNDVDDGACNATHCSLREAINIANITTGTDTIAFNLTTADPGYVVSTTSWRIQPTSSLPTITDPVVIDGYTQPGASPNTNGPGLGLNTVLKIELDGSLASANGLTISSGSSIVRGLAINRFKPNGIMITALGGGNVIEGNFIGTDVGGATPLGNDQNGLFVFTANNTIGGNTAAARNIIVDGGNGVLIFGSSASGNQVLGNFIGVDVTGIVAYPNLDGVKISGAKNNIIGGTNPNARNIISGNSSGVTIWNATASDNVVQGNFIGTDVKGTGAVPNGRGVQIRSGANNNLIGGTTAGAGNVISGNTFNGIDLGGSSNTVQGNFIGTQSDGESPLGNGIEGIEI